MPLIQSPEVIRVQPVYIGIDPGMGGGMAALVLTNEVEYLDIAEMGTEQEVWEWVRNWTLQKNSILYKPFAVIERVSAMPGNGVTSMFKFGASYGGLRMALTAAGIPFVDIQPQKWQKGLAIPGRRKDENKPQFKKRLQAKAQQMHPKNKITLGVADAVLLARYALLWAQGRAVDNT